MDKSLSDVLEREHHEIEASIEAFLEGLSLGETRVQELTRAVGALRRHIYIEEEFLFPPLRAAGMIPPVFVMLPSTARFGGRSMRFRSWTLTRTAQLVP